MDLTQLNNSIIELSRGVKKYSQDIKADRYIPNENKESIIQDKRAEVRGVAKDLHAQAKELAQSRRADLQTKRDASYLPAGDAAVAIEADNQKWTQIKGLLDSGIPATHVLNDAVERGDRRAIKVLADQFPSYNWAATGSKESGRYLDAALDTAKYQTGGTNYRAYADEIGKVDQAERAIDSNASSLDMDLNPAHTSSTLSNVMLTTSEQVVTTEPEGDAA